MASSMVDAADGGRRIMASRMGEVVGVGHNIEDPHASAALAADGGIDGEHAGR
jgi:hypothetical protein